MHNAFSLLILPVVCLVVSSIPCSAFQQPCSLTPLLLRPIIRYHPDRKYLRVSASPSIISMLSPSISAASGLIVSSTLGLMADKWIPNIGTVITLLISALATNLNILPTHHKLYDLCWTLFLPASLTLMLLSTESDTDSGNDTAPTTKIAPIYLVGCSFFVGSIGSILGCLSSFFIFQSRLTSAAVAAGCLCSSYIGGTINFFATSQIVGGGSDLMSSMAAADLLVMAVYFMGLTACTNFHAMQRLFTTLRNEATPQKQAMLDPQSGTTYTKPKASAARQIFTRSASTVLLALISFAIVHASNHIEQKLAPIIPGTACGIICASTLLIKCPLSKLTFWNHMQQAAKPMAALMFQLLFAQIGISANLGQAFSNGPTCILFSLWALAVHTMFILCGSLALRYTFLPGLRLEHVLVASNAAIGGPTTAAAFCGQLGILSLTVAATLWGVMGYALGTSIGVTLTRMLLQRQIFT